MSKQPLNFAPYSSPPGSPATAAKSATTKPNPWLPGGTSTYQAGSYQSGAGVEDLDTSRAGPSGFGSTNAAERGFGSGSGAAEVDSYETSLPVRLDMLSAGAYAIGPIGAILILLFEHSSGYARFHAYQSLMTCLALGILHILFLWSTFLSWIIFLFDLLLLGSLALQAYRDSDTLERYRLPYVGDQAALWTDAE